MTKKELLKDLFGGISNININYISSGKLAVGDPFDNLKTWIILNFNIRTSKDSNIKFTKGSLVQIKEFYRVWTKSKYYMVSEYKVILNPGNIEIFKDDKGTFSAIGIRKDFES